MTPTPKLRFVERNLGYTKIRVLQQWWEEDADSLPEGVKSFGEWRDVPVEVEQ